MTDEQPAPIRLEGDWFSLGFLIGFLEARLSEDEEWARLTAGPDYGEPHDPGVPGHHDRVLADVAAKRTLVREAARVIRVEPLSPDYWRGQRHAAVHTLRILALPYDDHSDFRAEWRL